MAAEPGLSEEQRFHAPGNSHGRGFDGPRDCVDKMVAKRRLFASLDMESKYVFDSITPGTTRITV